MTASPATPEHRRKPTGKLAENIMHFARVLRAAGLPIGPDRVVDALRALDTTGIERREDFYWTLAAVFLSKREQQDLFDQAFHIFWRDPQMLERMMSLLLPQVYGRAGQAEQPEASKRLSEALYAKREQAQSEEQQQEIEIDASLTFSQSEMLQHADFESMSGAELAQAKKLIARLRLPIPEAQTRRFHPDARGTRIDLPATLRASLRGGAHIIALKRRSRVTRHPPLVVLCDISGSMSRYSRMFLHFLHAITNDRDRVHTLVFGTRLTNITRHLRNRDVDIAMNRVAAAIQDWAGGTRIGVCLGEFNHKWSRRLLGQNAVVLLISDGLDRDVGEGLGAEMERLHKSCRKLVWLNPLLRYEGFQPRPSGVRAMLPHVDAFMPVHNIESLVDLARELEQGKWQRHSGRIAA
ncbi:MAG: VWA domain-containing protein [Betaproteobacteria bacterium]|nr:MAG: VWA domain-containing protein [Betaproteobacteria bacterium]